MFANNSPPIYLRRERNLNEGGGILFWTEGNAKDQ